MPWTWTCNSGRFCTDKVETMMLTRINTSILMNCTQKPIEYKNKTCDHSSSAMCRPTGWQLESVWGEGWEGGAKLSSCRRKAEIVLLVNSGKRNLEIFHPVFLIFFAWWWNICFLEASMVIDFQVERLQGLSLTSTAKMKNNGCVSCRNYTSTFQAVF